jgi:hypothetical protein
MFLSMPLHLGWVKAKTNPWLKAKKETIKRKNYNAFY